jgi:hypothetical protein
MGELVLDEDTWLGRFARPRTCSTRIMRKLLKFIDSSRNRSSRMLVQLSELTMEGCGVRRKESKLCFTLDAHPAGLT